MADTTTSQHVQVKKVYNNNVVLGIDSSGRDIVVNGRGVGFGHKPGDVVDTKGCQRFIAEGAYRPTSIATLLSSASDAEVNVAGRIVEMAQSRLGQVRTEAALLPVLDHLVAAVARARQGVVIDFPLTWEVTQLYPEEAACGRDAVTLAARCLGVDFQDDEWVAFALHFINQQWDQRDMSGTVAMTEAIASIFALLEKSWSVTIDRTSIAAARFVTHLRYLFARAKEGRQLDRIELDLMGPIKRKFPEAAAASHEIATIIASVAGVELTEAEVEYIALHASRLHGEVLPRTT